MEELLRQSFRLGQQWVKDIDDKKEPLSFTDWYNSKDVQALLIPVVNSFLKGEGNKGFVFGVSTDDFKWEFKQK